MENLLEKVKANKKVIIGGALLAVGAVIATKLGNDTLITNEVHEMMDEVEGITPDEEEYVEVEQTEE